MNRCRCGIYSNNGSICVKCQSYYAKQDDNFAYDNLNEEEDEDFSILIEDENYFDSFPEDDEY